MKRYVEAGRGVAAKTECGRSETSEMSRLIYFRQIKVQLICQLSMREHSVHTETLLGSDSAEQKKVARHRVPFLSNRRFSKVLSIVEIGNSTLGLRNCVFY
jgi:hypothetical protein